MGQFLAALAVGEIAAVATALTAVTAVSAGNARKSEYKMQARQEEFASKDREVQRRKRLVSALASQNAYRGATGVRAFEGSSAAVMNSDRDQFEYDQTMGAANISMTQQSLLTSGKYAQQSGYMSAGASMLGYKDN